MQIPDGSATSPFIKDPDAPLALDYAVDWTDWLKPVNDTLATSAWAILTTETDPPLVIDSDVSNTTVATVWLKGGKVGVKYALRNRITTAGGRGNDKTIYVKIKEQ